MCVGSANGDATSNETLMPRNYWLNGRKYLAPSLKPVGISLFIGASQELNDFFLSSHTVLFDINEIQARWSFGKKKKTHLSSSADTSTAFSIYSTLYLTFDRIQFFSFAILHLFCFGSIENYRVDPQNIVTKQVWIILLDRLLFSKCFCIQRWVSDCDFCTSRGVACPPWTQAHRKSFVCTRISSLVAQCYNQYLSRKPKSLHQ